MDHCFFFIDVSFFPGWDNDFPISKLEIGIFGLSVQFGGSGQKCEKCFFDFPREKIVSFFVDCQIALFLGTNT